MTKPMGPLKTPAVEAAELSPLQRAFLALEETQARLTSMEQAAREPIAVIGLGCRVPGGGNNPAGFWRLMHEGVDAISPIPEDRWDANAFYDPDPDTPGRIATRYGGFLPTVDQFDPSFFNISPREAVRMDPQQRLLLEVSWEALEHAGQAPDRLERSLTGVYMGLASSDYTYLQVKSRDPAQLDPHFASGIAHSVATGRISYLLGLQGPSVTVDTACSSSLVAVHLACTALRNRECHMALAGGVNLILAPDLFIALSRARMLAPDGRCKTFDATADGFSRAEGCGVIVLKRLSDAQADGDRILGLIRGSAVNQDGPSSGLTAPNGPAQEAVIREALSRAGVAPREVGYVEAHGTGTQLGDPLEVSALGAVFAGDRDPARPLLIGSVKTNIGHLEGAAGVVSLIKVILALQHRTIPPHLHFHTPSPHIAWGELPLRVPTKTTAWEPIDGRRIGGVSSFGFSGTNAHIILEEAPPGHPLEQVEPRRCCLLTLSARDDKAFAELANRFADGLEGRSDDELADVCHTANVGRANFSHRGTVIARSIEDLRTGLTALALGKEASGIRTARITRRDPPRIAFLFTGQGAQYPGMSRGLYEASPVFRAALDRCAELLAPYLDRPLLEVLFPAREQPTVLDETAYTQPALFAVEYALSELWRSCGVTPNAVMGHSVGEYVAACVAGVLTLEDALRLVARRGRLMQSLPPGGAMAAIFAPEDRVGQAISAHTKHLSIASINGPAQTVISGRAAEVEAVCEYFRTQDIRCQPLPVSHAFHSPLVEPILDQFEEEANAVRFAPPRMRLISNLTGRLADGGEVRQANYWRRHVREAVRFSDGLRTLHTLRPDIVIEIGPNPTLLTFASSAFDDDAPLFAASLRKGRPDWEHMLEGLAAIYGAGVQVDWRGVSDGTRRRIVDLPTYPFQRERWWFEAKTEEEPVAARLRPTGHPLLGARLRSAGTEAIYESRANADSPSFIRQHRVLGKIILPGTAYLDMLTTCARALDSGEVICIEDVQISEAMFFDEDGADTVIQTVCSPVVDGVATASINGAIQSDEVSDQWVRHVTAKIRVSDLPALEPVVLRDCRAQCTDSVSLTDFYTDLERRGVDFGGGFRVIRQLWRGESQACAEIALSPEFANDTPKYQIHPVLLDGCLQVMASAFSAGAAEDALYVPIGVGRFMLYRQPGQQCWSHATVQSGTGDSRLATVRIFDASGILIAELRDVHLKRVIRNAPSKLAPRWLDQSLWEVCWEAEPPAGQISSHAWTMATLCRAASDASDRLREVAGIEAYDVFLKSLEALCADFVVETMLRLGGATVLDERMTDGDIAARLGVVERHRRLFSRLLEILAETGWLARENDVWRLKRPLVDQSPARTLERLLLDCPRAAKPELELTARVAKQLDKALRGECDALELLFPKGSIATMEGIYRDSPGAKYFNGLMTEVVAAVTRAKGAGRRLRILELGGGTGGTTAHLTPRLSADDVEYTFTDVGPTFVAAAHDRFKQHTFMSFEVLDLERDPEAQGFANRQFDVVVASNVIHATGDLRRTLARVRRLLAPDGLLAVLEVTAPQRWFDLTVGLTPGWWAFEDTDLRPNYPTMPRDRWIRVLSESGFENVVALPEGRQHGCLALQSLLLARASSHQQSCDWLIFADRSGLGSRLADCLRERGDRCTLVQSGPLVINENLSSIDPSSPQQYRALLAGLRSAGRSVTGVIHAWSLDCAQWDGLSAADLAKAQSVGAVSAMHLAQALIEENPAPRLWLVTRGAQQAHVADGLLSPAQAPVWGLGKTLMMEHPELRCVCVDLAPRPVPAEVDAVLAELTEPGVEQQVALREPGRRVARLARAHSSSSSLPGAGDQGPWQLAPAGAGTLDNFRRQPMTRRSPGIGEVEIAVEATGLNFKDVLNVLGMYPGEAGPLGGECAGRVTAVGPGVTSLSSGDAVLAVTAGSFASHVIAKSELVRRLPPGISVEEGSSFPIAFLTAEYCLSHLADVQSGDRVLIHAAAGGVGMAAVRLAQRAGAEVFATAGSQRKRELLRSIGVKHVHDSRSTDFADKLLDSTDGRGVDIVLNSLSGEQIDASFRVLARGGRFVEIGKRGIKSSEWVTALNRDLRYFVVDWGETAAKEPALIGEMLARLVDELGRGMLAPLPHHVFSLDDIDRAYRLMAQARHVGKIVVRHGQRTKSSLRRDGTYLITGGLSGLGLLVAQSLAAQGAGRLVLVSRRGASADTEKVLNSIRNAGSTTVVAEALDVSDETALNELLTRIRRDGPPLRGVVHSAGVLDDAGLIQQDSTRFARVFAPKVQGGWLLDRLTRVDALDWFVMFSSAAAVLGSAGQANHAAANAFLDVLARERRLQGLPGLSINWGAWTDVGAAADRGLTDQLAARGLGALKPSDGLLALDFLLNEDYAQVAVVPVDWRRYLDNSNRGSFSLLTDVSKAAATERKHTSSNRPTDVDFRERLANAPAARRSAMVANLVREYALRALGLDPARSIDPRTPLGELGLDSLLSVELRNALRSAIGVPLPATLLFDFPTIDTLTTYLLSVLSPDDVQRVLEPVGDAPHGSLLGSIEELSEEEVDRLLAARVEEKSPHE